MNIALVTYQDQGAYHQTSVENEDDLLINFLNSRGLSVEKTIWNNQEVNWEKYDLVILKSPWDYFNLIEDFYEWLNLLKSKNVKVLNPADTLKWNADKHYLIDIEQAGLSVTPSIFLAKGTKANLQQYFKHFKVDTLICKPVVSGGSKNTFKITLNNLDEFEQKIDLLLSHEEFIIQPFLSEIETRGEWSFIFFGGNFSHALLKKVKANDFRVQTQFGGTIHLHTPLPSLLNSAQEYIDRFAKNCLYARVDGAIVNDKFILMELELIEPFLFLETNPHSLENYYRALSKMITSNITSHSH